MRAYEHWPSNNKIYCNGRFITGPDNGAFWAAEILTAIPTVLFWVFVCVPLWQDVDYGPLFIFPSILLTGLVVGCHFAASFVEPGIIPRTSSPIPENLSREETHNGQPVTVTFCKTCRIWKPPRAHHCRDCDNCILEFDHHCPWVGNCVGKRNYRWFNLFLWFIVIDALYIPAVSILHFAIKAKAQPEPWVQVFPSSPVHIILCVYSIFILLTITGLCGYHCSLICSGKTTYEAIKKIEGDPIQESCIFRFYSVLCGPPFPSLIRLRDPIDIFEERPDETVPLHDDNTPLQYSSDE